MAYRQVDRQVDRHVRFRFIIQSMKSKVTLTNWQWVSGKGQVKWLESGNRWEWAGKLRWGEWDDCRGDGSGRIWNDHGELEILLERMDKDGFQRRVRRPQADCLGAEQRQNTRPQVDGLGAGWRQSRSPQADGQGDVETELGTSVPVPPTQGTDSRQTASGQDRGRAGVLRWTAWEQGGGRAGALRRKAWG